MIPQHRGAPRSLKRQGCPGAGDGHRRASVVPTIPPAPGLQARALRPRASLPAPPIPHLPDLGIRGGPTPGAQGDGQAIAEWHTDGLPIEQLTLSSDGGGCLPNFDRHGVLQSMAVGRSSAILAAVSEAVALGVPLPKALAPCTSAIARQLRLHDRGRLAAGLRADLVVLDPGMKVRHCLAAGRWLVRDGAPVVRGLFETG